SLRLTGLVSCVYCSYTRCVATAFSSVISLSSFSLCFFFNDTSTTEFYTLSLHDALPISCALGSVSFHTPGLSSFSRPWPNRFFRDRKSTRLNSSHVSISYAVFCLKKKIKSKRKD